MLSRKINWISSILPEHHDVLTELNEQLNRYYSTLKTRQTYGQLIDEEVANNPVTNFFLNWFEQKNSSFKKVLEIGCGSGRIWNQLKYKTAGLQYTGLEVDKDTIVDNQLKWPDEQWVVSSVYDWPEKSSYDLCFSFYVLEHLVFPKRALDCMYSFLKPGGTLLLVFPDFMKTGRFPSQHIGMGPERSTKELLKKGNLTNAALTLWDSKTKLSPALKKLENRIGEFLVNTNPVCLHYQETQIWPDIDAVYLANKMEVIHWAKSVGAAFDFPAGSSSPFDEHTIIEIRKSM